MIFFTHDIVDVTKAFLSSKKKNMDKERSQQKCQNVYCCECKKYKNPQIPDGFFVSSSQSIFTLYHFVFFDCLITSFGEYIFDSSFCRMTENPNRIQWGFASSLESKHENFNDIYSLPFKNCDHGFSSSMSSGRHPSSGTDHPTDKTDDDSIIFERGLPQSLLSSPPQEMMLDYPFTTKLDNSQLDCVSNKLAKCKIILLIRLLLT